jgi:ABC-2 type transport system permease protein
VLRKLSRIAGKELTGFFASPAAVLFLAAFLGVTLFVFFWAAAFFERNLADLRPLFQWMPLLLIFLVAALTMRSWAEERRSGTLELLLTSPTTPTEHVLGKFLGVLMLVLLALALTLPLPITVSLLGPLDWGPVIGGYAAAVCLAAAYVSIGLWISSRTDNQIVSLILTVLIAGAFYLIGSDTLTGLADNRTAEWLRDLGAGLALHLDHPRGARLARSLLLFLDHGPPSWCSIASRSNGCAGPATPAAARIAAGTPPRRCWPRICSAPISGWARLARRAWI